jgi:hypothetical protein
MFDKLCYKRLAKRKIFFQNRHEVRFLPSYFKFLVLSVKSASFPAAVVNVVRVLRQ